MSGEDPNRGGFFFLFRTDEGEIARPTWWKGMAAIFAPMLILTLGWIALEPVATRPPDRQGMLAAATLGAYVYLMFYAFAVILAAVCYYNLSAKRFRARSRPASLAGLAPFGLLLCGAMDWLAPRSEGYVPAVVPMVLFGLTALVAAWSVVDLGILGGGGERR
jgi:hypothetical protein